jgi:hypothetical protein
MTRARQELAIFRFQSPDLHSTFTEELFPPKPAPKMAPLRSAQPKPVGKKQPAIDQRAIQLAAAAFAVGDAVTHSRFGSGVVTARQGDIVTIQFDDGKLKRVSLSVALEQRQLKHGKAT